MWNVKRQLTARGYWDEASPGDGTGGSAGGEAGDGDATAANTAANAATAAAAGKGDPDPALKALQDQLAKEQGEKAKLLKETMQRKDELKTLADKLKSFDGIDVTQVRKLLDEQKSAQTRELEEKGQWDALKKQMNDQHAVDLAARDTTIAELQSKLSFTDQLVGNLTVGSAFGQSKFIADELNLTPGKARIVYGSHFENQDGAIVAFDKPAGSANRTMFVDGKGDPLGFEEAITKIVKADPDYDRMVRTKSKPGAGTGTAGAPPNAGRPVTDQSGLVGRYRIAEGLKAANAKR